MFSDKKAQACRIYTTRGECLWYDNKFGSSAHHWKKKFLLFLLQLVQLHSRTDSGQFIREIDVICTQPLRIITFVIYLTLITSEVDSQNSPERQFPVTLLICVLTYSFPHSEKCFLLWLFALLVTSNANEVQKLVLFMQLIKSDQSS